MGKLALQYPLAYSSIFEPMTDFEVRLPDNVGTTDKELWIDYSSHGPPFVAGQGIILPATSTDPDEHVLNTARFRTTSDTLRIAIFQGEKRHLKLLQLSCDIVALPWYKRGRMSYVEPDTSHIYHLYGFCNLDELRRYPVRSISTSIPFTAAAMGIDLRNRERRPKHLPTFSYEMKLTEAQIQLAITNTNAIREALALHGEP